MILLEQMARAIYEEDDPWSKVWEWPNLHPDPKMADKYRGIALAALRAMQNPTPGMVEAGEAVSLIFPDEPDIANIWSAMVAKAIEEGEAERG